MITETKEIYKCEHCNKLYQIKRFCLKHEKACSQNPENNRACIGCLHLNKKRATVFIDAWDGEHEINPTLLHCDKLNKYVYPLKVEHKGNAFDTEPDLNEPMPKECEFYEQDQHVI